MIGFFLLCVYVCVRLREGQREIEGDRDMEKVEIER